MKHENSPIRIIFFLTRVKFIGLINEGSTITPLNSRIDAIINFLPPSNKKEIQELLGMLKFFKNMFIKCNYLQNRFIIFE